MNKLIYILLAFVSLTACTKEKEEVNCLILYPDQLNGNKDLLDLESKFIDIAQFSGFKKVAAKLAMVDFPEPDEPTKAVTLPIGASKEIL